MSIFQSIPYVNPAERLADAESLVTQTQSDNAFAEQLTQQAILGIGDADAARHLLSTVRELLGQARINQQFWLEVAKTEKEVFKKIVELIKSN
jgi:hypothetical protein